MAPRKRWKWILALLAAALAVLLLCGVVAVALVRHRAEWVVLPTHRYFAGAPEPLDIAHRGASAEALEHSAEAYRKALGEGADVLELDVRMTRDEVLVLAHDPDLLRVAGSSLLIAESTLDEIIAATGARAPLTLEQALDLFPDARLNIEIKAKGEGGAEVASALAALLARRGREQNVLVASFHCDALDAFRAASGGRVATSACAAEGIRFYLCYLLDIPARPRYAALQLPAGTRLAVDTPAFIDFAHRHGLKVHFWVVDDVEEMARILRAGADGIMTNRPGMLARAIAAHRE